MFSSDCTGNLTALLKTLHRKQTVNNIVVVGKHFKHLLNNSGYRLKVDCSTYADLP